MQLLVMGSIAGVRVILWSGLLVPVFCADGILTHSGHAMSGGGGPVPRVPDDIFRKGYGSVVSPGNEAGRDSSWKCSSEKTRVMEEEQTRMNERVFGCISPASEISKPRKIDFSFGQPLVPFAWWDVAPLVTEVAAESSDSAPKQFEAADLRAPEYLSTPVDSREDGLSLIPLLFVGVLGLLLRRER